ncbi:MAG: hypothetical protein ACYDEX_26740, partial [Mobilitalea sp.]
VKEVMMLTINNTTNVQLDISLVYEERMGDIIFLIGTILAIVSTYQAEQSIIDKLFMIKSSEKSAYTIATASWLFFIASLIFVHVAIVGTAEFKNNINTGTSYSTIRASQIIMNADIIKSIGFGLASIGSQLRVRSLSRT